MASDPRNRSPRPGFVLNVDKQTPPLLFHHGDNFRLEKLPADRTRVIYPAEPLPGLPDGGALTTVRTPSGDVGMKCLYYCTDENQTHARSQSKFTP